MTVKLHQPVAGLTAGAEYTGPMEAWLVVNGYASRAADTTDKTNLTAALPAVDPTNPENREAPGQPFKVFGEDVEGDEKGNAVETPGNAPAAPVLPQLVLGRDETAEQTEQREALDGSVDPATVEGFPAELEEATAASEAAAETGNHLENEPTDEVKAPKKRSAKTVNAS